jgi:hypothetical protein
MERIRLLSIDKSIHIATYEWFLPISVSLGKNRNKSNDIELIASAFAETSASDPISVINGLWPRSHETRSVLAA